MRSRSRFLTWRTGVPVYWLDGEVVSDEALAQRGLPIPPTPTETTWCTMVARKERCGLCWAVTRHAPDYARHLWLVHDIVPEVRR